MSHPAFFCLMHVPFEGPGMIEPYLEEKGFLLQKIKLYDDQSLPAADDVDYLIVMGGPMNMEDEEKYPWLTGETELIKEMIDLGKPVLGICFGAELIAHVLDKSVHPAKDHEIGWHPIELTLAGKSHPATKHWSVDPIVFHWHSNTFNMPDGAVHLASTNLCINQAFVVNENIIGLQFHLEIAQPQVQAMINNWGRYQKSGDYVQSSEEMLRKSEEISKKVKILLYYLLDYWIKET